MSNPPSVAAVAPAASAPQDPRDIAFRLVSVETTSTPEGCVGRDWLVYQIAQGANLIVGYRRGVLQTVTAEVEQIVVGLNQRRVSGKGRSAPSRGRPPAATAAARAANPPSADD